LALDIHPIFKEGLPHLIKDQLGGIQMLFFNRKIVADKRSGKDRRKSHTGFRSGSERRSGIERRCGRDRRMSLYDRLPQDQKNTLEIIIKHLESQAT
jgi:hypothetical protein